MGFWLLEIVKVRGNRTCEFRVWILEVSGYGAHNPNSAADFGGVGREDLAEEDKRERIESLGAGVPV